MRQRVPVSEARTRLSRLLKQLQEDPDTVFEITVNDLVLDKRDRDHPKANELAQSIQEKQIPLITTRKRSRRPRQNIRSAIPIWNSSRSGHG